MPINPLTLQAQLGIAAGLLLGGIALGGYTGWDWASARADREIAALRDQQKTALLKAVAEANAKRDAQQQRADQLAYDLSRAEFQIAAARVELSRRVPRVTTVYKSAPDAAQQPLPVAVYTRGFVGVWNSALAGADLPAAGQAAADTAEASADADLVASPLTQAELLDNHIDNASRCRAIAVQLDTLIQWHEEQSHE